MSLTRLGVSLRFEDMFGEGKGLEIEDSNYLYLGNVTSNKNTGSGASNYSMFLVLRMRFFIGSTDR